MAKIAAFSRVFENMCVAIPMGAMMVLLAIAAFGFEGAEARGKIFLGTPFNISLEVSYRTLVSLNSHG
jgi:hypothetical protein